MKNYFYTTRIRYWVNIKIAVYLNPFVIREAFKQDVDFINNTHPGLNPFINRETFKLIQLRRSILRQGLNPFVNRETFKRMLS
mgnify:CR=1 FL=1